MKDLPSVAFDRGARHALSGSRLWSAPRSVTRTSHNRAGGKPRKTYKDLIVGYAQLGAESEWRSANTTLLRKQPRTWESSSDSRTRNKNKKTKSKPFGRSSLKRWM